MSSLVCLCVYVPRNSHTNSTLYTLTPAPHRPLPRPAHHPRHQAAPPCSTRPARGRAQTAGTGRPCVCACTRPAEYTYCIWYIYYKLAFDRSSSAAISFCLNFETCSCEDNPQQLQPPTSATAVERTSRDYTGPHPPHLVPGICTGARRCVQVYSSCCHDDADAGPCCFCVCHCSGVRGGGVCARRQDRVGPPPAAEIYGSGVRAHGALARGGAANESGSQR